MWFQARSSESWAGYHPPPGPQAGRVQGLHTAGDLGHVSPGLGAPLRRLMLLSRLQGLCVLCQVQAREESKCRESIVPKLSGIEAACLPQHGL